MWRYHALFDIYAAKLLLNPLNANRFRLSVGSSCRVDGGGVNFDSELIIRLSE